MKDGNFVMAGFDTAGSEICGVNDPVTVAVGDDSLPGFAVGFEPVEVGFAVASEEGSSVAVADASGPAVGVSVATDIDSLVGSAVTVDISGAVTVG